MFTTIVQKLFIGVSQHSMLSAVGAADSGMRGGDGGIAVFVLALFFFIFIFIFILILAIAALILASYWKIFKKAGHPGWTALVPFYNTTVLLEMIGKPLWWVVLVLIPGVNIVISVIITIRIAKVFGKGGGFGIGLILLPFIFAPILAFGKAQYSNSFPPAGPLKETTKWALIGLGAYMLYVMFFFSISASFATNNPGSISLQVLTRSDGTASGYAIDGAHVYYDDVLVAHADPAAFTLEGAYGLDQNSVYYGGNAITGASASTFTALSNIEYGSDAAHVYQYGSIITGADPNTFSLIDDNYSKDSHSVYFQGSKIDGGDANTFTIPKNGHNSGYGVDTHTVYYEGVVVAGADSATFEVVDQNVTAYAGNLTYDAKDARHRYLSGNIVR